jgi:chromosomal replication initiation ATPase DnaA
MRAEMGRLIQLTFDLSRPGAFGRADFFASEANAAALGWIERWPEWPSPVLVLHGERGAGKTHLAHLWCERAGADLVLGEALDQGHVARMLERRRANIAVDNAERAPEETLLHLFNACVEVGGSLLVTTRRAPGDWPFALPDLGSRIRAAPAVGIAGPDDALLSAALVKHFADRQLRISPEIIAYLVSRMERSLAAAAAVAAALDQAALYRRGPITKGMASRALAALAGQSLSPDADAGVR